MQRERLVDHSKVSMYFDTFNQFTTWGEQAKRLIEELSEGPSFEAKVAAGIHIREMAHQLDKLGPRKPVKRRSDDAERKKQLQRERRANNRDKVREYKRRWKAKQRASSG